MSESTHNDDNALVERLADSISGCLSNCSDLPMWMQPHALGRDTRPLLILAARAVISAGYRLTEECEACGSSGLYPNPTGVFYAPTEWLGCPDCMGAGRLIRPTGGDQ
jgi:hypothetical protein